MSDKNDGGLAFPFFDERCMNSPECGMTLRDYFAAKAVAEIIADMVRRGSTDKAAATCAASAAYVLADAMLAERAK